MPNKFILINFFFIYNIFMIINLICYKKSYFNKKLGLTNNIKIFDFPKIGNPYGILLENTLITFPNTLEHTGTTHTDVPFRYVLNVNYI